MKIGARGPFGTQLKAFREAAGFTQEELATIAGLSLHAISALERGQRRRPHVETVRALSAALDLTGPTREALLRSARAPAHDTAVEEFSNAPLPLPLTVLLGRDRDIQTLRLWLADPVARLITLIGPGGVGKTRLALEVARAIAEEGLSRVVFVPLAAIRDPAFVAPAVAEGLGLSDVTALDLPRRARVACAGQPTLLVLDNFEQVLDAAPLATDLLTAVASLRLLATSRTPLHLRGEREYAVGPLALEVDPDARSPADLARAPAVRLFMERARDVQPAFRLTVANGPTVTAICRRLDALPLALELAAPWMKALTAEDLLHRLEHDVLLSSAGPRDLPERQQTMNATVAWTYQLLDPREQRVFRRLGALPGRFSIEAAAAVLAGRDGSSAAGNVVLDAMAGLIDKSLLQRANTTVATRPLYQMLETVRAFASLELNVAGERDDALEGLAGYCIGDASLAVEGLVGPAQVEWVDRVRDDLENYRVALAWLIDGGRSSEASDIVWQLNTFWMIRGHTVEGLGWSEQILNLPSRVPAAESRALACAGALRYMRGDLERAHDALAGALALASRAGDVSMTVQVENLLGHVESARGNVGAARELFTRSLEGFLALGMPWGAGNALTGLAGASLAAGDAGEAARLLDEATSMLRRAGPWFLSLALYVRANLAVRRGNPDETIAVVRESLTHIRQLQDKFAFVYALVPLAAAAALKGDDEWVARILGTGDAVTERTGATVVDSSVHDLRGEAERKARARLGPKRWALAYAAGQNASLDSLLGDIDRFRT
jgi:predicted ATPase/transcriptional regulator with XRE-family HTH domain